MRFGLLCALTVGLFTTVAFTSTVMSTVSADGAASSTPPSRGPVKKIDSHLHIWSEGKEPYPWVVEPPPQLQKTATAEALYKAAKDAGVSGALIVQPANHKFDHSYVAHALSTYPAFFRGMCLIDGSLPPLEAVASLEKHWADGFVGVRFNPALFPQGLDGPTARAVYQRAGELHMPVGIMTFGGLVPHVPAIRALVQHAAGAKVDTSLILDHMGFFRQPATGGLLGDAAANDEAAWQALLSLADLPTAHVKVSAFFRLSARLPPHADLAPRLGQLLGAFGPERLLWGSDFPFCTIGGNGPTEAKSSYTQAAGQIGQWPDVPGLDDAAFAAIMGGNAKRLFGFWD